eukprot:4285312-Pleurochrysis_carterae.AAC.1
MDIDATPHAFDIVSLAPLYLSLRNEFIFDALPIGMPKEISVSFFSIHLGVEAAPVVLLQVVGYPFWRRYLAY